MLRHAAGSVDKFNRRVFVYADKQIKTGVDVDIRGFASSGGAFSHNTTPRASLDANGS